MDLGTAATGKKRSLDAQINLVPFIDLMAVTISFLIMTAVWNQAGRLEVASAAGGATETAAPTVPITLELTTDRVRLTIAGAPAEALPLTRDATGRLKLEALTGRLAEVRTALPAQRNVTVIAEDAVRYDDLVRVIDQCLGAGLTGVQVSPTG